MTKSIIKKILITIVILCGAFFMLKKVINIVVGNIMTNSLKQTRSTLYGDVPKEKRLLVGFGKRIEHEIRYGSKEGYTTVQDYLDAGCNPNYCLNLSEGWQFNNPLMLFNTAALYVTFIEEKPFYPDVTVFGQLMAAGAEINRYPYVWAAVFCRGNWFIDTTINYFKDGQITEEEKNYRIISGIKDRNRVLKLFLDAGADVNRKGSPIPFDFEKSKRMTEDEVQSYFNSPEATTPLYEAIKKGSAWETQVDLLLQYGARVDETCLEAAKFSGDEKMIKKVEALLSGA